VIAGPTGVGKTRGAIAVAEQIGGEEIQQAVIEEVTMISHPTLLLMSLEL